MMMQYCLAKLWDILKENSITNTAFTTVACKDISLDLLYLSMRCVAFGVCHKIYSILKEAFTFGRQLIFLCGQNKVFLCSYIVIYLYELWRKYYFAVTKSVDNLYTNCPFTVRICYVGSFHIIYNWQQRKEYAITICIFRS